MLWRLTAQIQVPWRLTAQTQIPWRLTAQIQVQWRLTAQIQLPLALLHTPAEQEGQVRVQPVPYVVAGHAVWHWSSVKPAPH